MTDSSQKDGKAIRPTLWLRAVSAARTFPQRLLKKCVDGIAGIVTGVIFAVAVFAFTSNKIPTEEQKDALRREATAHVADLQLAKPGTSAEAEFIDSFKTSFNSEVIVIYGKFEPKTKSEGASDGLKSSIFLALFEDGPKSLTDTVLNKEPRKILSGFALLGDYPESKISDLRVEDVLGTGEKAILFDLIHVYGDGRAVSPIILAKREGAWAPILLPFDDKDPRDALIRAKPGTMQLSSTNKFWLFKDFRRRILNDDGEPITFTEKWTLSFNKKDYDFLALRNSSGYRDYKNPATGLRQIFLLMSYADDAVLAPHHVYVRVLALKQDINGARWVPDETWFGGAGAVSQRAQDYKDFDFDEIYEGGYNENDKSGTYWMGASFSKEMKASQVRR